MKRPLGKILVIRGGAIGDFILTLPALAALRKAFPDASLTVLGYPQIASLALRGGIVDDVKSIEARALAGFFARNGNLDPALQDFFANFAIILSFLYDPDELFKTNVARCSKAQFIQGPHRPVESELVHATEVLLKPLERLAIFDEDRSPHLNIHPPFQQTLPQGKWLAFHPGSGSEKKNWPEHRWAEFLRNLANEPALRFLLIGGEAEGERLDRLLKLLPADRCVLARNQPLPLVAELLRQTHFFIGHDSGISHLAGAVGTPGLLLWGETSVEVWRPPSPALKLLAPLGSVQPLALHSAVLSHFAL